MKVKFVFFFSRSFLFDAQAVWKCARVLATAHLCTTTGVCGIIILFDYFIIAIIILFRHSPFCTDFAAVAADLFWFFRWHVGVSHVAIHVPLLNSKFISIGGTKTICS